MATKSRGPVTVQPLVQPNLHLRDRPGKPGEYLRSRVAQRVGRSTYVLAVGPFKPLTP